MSDTAPGKEGQILVSKVFNPKGHDEITFDEDGRIVLSEQLRSEIKGAIAEGLNVELTIDVRRKFRKC